MNPPNTTNPKIIGMRVDATTYQNATEQILRWAKAQESRYTCVANVHMVMEAYDDPDFRSVVNASDMVTPDGMPLVWALRWLGYPLEDRVYGPTLTLWVMEAAARQGIPVGFYGASPDVLQKLIENVKNKFPLLQVVYAWSPPFRESTHEEDEVIVREINTSGTRILFVGLGCPKQERWMASHKGRVRAVMLGVGAAFDFHAGMLKQAPGWMQDRGLEWLFRLLVEPGRLWKRYLKHNPRFAILILMQIMGLRQ